MNIMLVGNPNAGKSTIFNALTGKHAKVGNWHGVTVGVAEGKMKLGDSEYTVCDLPGIYSLDSMSMEEGVTRDYLSSHPSDFALFVSECSGLERTLPLLRSVCAEGKRACLVLTKSADFYRNGGKLDVNLLSARLGLPVFLADARSRRGVSALKARLTACLSAPSVTLRDEPLTGAYSKGEAKLSAADRLLCNGFFCIPLFFLLLFGAFYATFGTGMPGTLLKDAVERFFKQFLAGKAEAIASPVVRGFLIDGILNGLGSVLCFIPQISVLFLALILMEESGFLSRLAMLTDGLFAKVGLNGRAIFSLLMGFGCTAAAILTTRGLDDKRIQRRVILCLPYISCSAKLPVFLALSASFFDNPFFAVLLLYSLGVGLSFSTALLLRGKEPPPFVLELSPLQIPNALFVLKSLLFQLKQFIIKTATVILAFFLLSWLLSSFDFSFRYCQAEESMLATICAGLKYLFAPIGCCDWRIAYAALSGLVAKENVAGVLAMFCGGFPYSAKSAFAFAVFVLTCSPCVSAIAATARETGRRRAALYAMMQTGSALLFSYAAYYALNGGWAVLFAAVAMFIAVRIIRKKTGEKVRGAGGNLSAKYYG
ncbi:MAG: FeoB small GTPase domain-containing protein [Candidatus Gallimonas sp.]